MAQFDPSQYDSNQSCEPYGVVLVTASSPAEAEMIAETLIQAHLAACVTILPIRSIYRWQGTLCKDNECQLLIKTRLDRFAELETAITAVHSYNVPELIALPIVQGASPYLQWLSEQMDSDLNSQ
jgi:periplasmic divalent cation tolerance protein